MLSTAGSMFRSVPLAETRLCALSIDVYPAGLSQPVHEHEFASLGLLLSGKAREESNGEERRGGSLNVIVKPRGAPHATSFGEAPAVILSMVLPKDSSNAARLRRWEWLETPLLAARMMQLFCAGATSSAAIDEAAAEVVTRCASHCEDTVRDLRPPAWLARTKELLAQERQPIAAAAAGVGVHRGSLARAFAAHYGVTPVEFRRWQRLKRAVDRLVSTDRSIADVAHLGGFSDQSHLAREMRSLLRVSPREIRRLTVD